MSQSLTIPVRHIHSNCMPLRRKPSRNGRLTVRHGRLELSLNSEAISNIVSFEPAWSELVGYRGFGAVQVSQTK